MRPPSILTALALVPAILCCARELPHGDQVTHLELRLADGRSPAQELSSAQVTWVEELVIDGPQTDLGTWSVQYGRVDPLTPPGSPLGTPGEPQAGIGTTGGPETSAGPQGIALTGIVPDVLRMKRVELHSARSFQASEVDFLELELLRTTAGIARVSWRNSLESVEQLAYPWFATAVVAGGESNFVVRIPLSSQPGWAGEISEFTLAPKEDGVQRFGLRAVRLGRIGFSPGPDVMETLSSDGEVSRDGGLIAMGREARRAFPSDWNVPLFARARVPRGGLLSIEAGVSPNTTNLTAEVRFSIEARARSEDPWMRIGSTSVIPGMRAGGPEWEHLSVSLKAFEGGEVELRFLANADRDPTPDGTLARARLYWGEPLILPELAPASGSGERRPNVVLVTLDTVRRDAVGAYASSRAPSPTPFLDSLAARGLVFEQAWSACNATSPSHASLMTGLAVQDHGVLDNRSLLAAENVTLAERFRAAGWQTAAAVSVPHLTPERSGLGQGFDRVWLGTVESAGDGARTVGAVREWWRSFAREGPRPTFLWLHLFDAHTPYHVPDWFLADFAKRLGVKPPPTQADPSSMPETPFAAPGGFLAEVTNVEWPEFQYRAAVAYQDELLRQLFAEFKSEFSAEDTFVAVVADHGEALGEHGNWYHHTSLYREVMQVPLIVVPPGSSHGTRVAEPVWSLDLSRTLFGLAGGPPPSECRGLDLLEFAAARERPVRRIFFEHSGLAQVGAADTEHTALYTELEYLQRGRERSVPADTLELFDAARDPQQQAPLKDFAPELSTRYRELFREWRASALERRRVEGRLSEDDLRFLDQLGY